MTPEAAVKTSEKKTPKQSPSKMPWAVLARQTASTFCQRMILTKYVGLTQPLTALVAAPSAALANTPVTATANSAKGREGKATFGTRSVMTASDGHRT